MAKIEKTETCWIWTGFRNAAGYGKLWFEGRKDYAHRVAYRLFRGEIPPKMTIDHLCRNRACVNPSHLEVVTQRENVLRGEAPTSINKRKTHCPKGHSYEGNVYLTRAGHRTCRRCRLDYMAARTVRTRRAVPSF